MTTNFMEEKAKRLLPINDKFHGGTTEIQYNDECRIAVPTAHLEDVVQILSTKNRVHIIKSANKAIKKNYKKVMSGNASREATQNFMHDIMIWKANEILKEK